MRIGAWAGLAMLAVACGGANPRELAPAGAARGSESGGGGAASAPSAEEQLRERLRPMLSALTAEPFGTCAAITAAQGSLTVTLVAGTLWEGGPAANAETPFNVASVSKLLTAARVVSLDHAGSIDLDESLAVRLPGVELLTSEGTPVAAIVTVRHLLRHRSGLPPFPPDLEAQLGGTWTAPDLLTQLTNDWKLTLTGPVGGYAYSNLGYALLGAIVERVEGCSFADCMASYLAGLGMSGAFFWPDQLTSDGAHGRVMVDGAPVFHPPSWYGSRYALPFTGLWTSMPGLARFGRRLAADAKDAASAHHAMSEGSGHGLGPVHGTRLGAASLEHDGSGPGFHASLVVIPELDVTLAMATNGGNQNKEEAAAFAAIVDAALQAVPTPP